MSVSQQVLVGKMRTAAGQRDKYVRIEASTDTVGLSGFPVPTWATLRSAWMGRLDVRADETFGASRLAAAVETNWYCDYATDMDPETVNVPKARRLVYKGRTFDILSATLIERRAIEIVTLAKADE